MTRRERAFRMLIAVGGSTAGLVVGHLIDYRLAVPQADRAAVLHASGHAYLPYAILGSLCVAILAGLAAGRLGYLSGTGRGGAVLGYRATAVRLTTMQMVGFLALETGERVAVGSSLAELVGPILWLGLGLQVVAALAVSGLLGLIHRAARVVGRLLGRGARSTASQSDWSPVALEAAPVRDPFTDARPTRGPPKILLATS